jgi:hypothetical protein
MNFKNTLERDCYNAARKVCGGDVNVEHNKTLTIATAICREVASFAGPPKKEIDVITARLRENPALDLLISCKEFGEHKAEPAHVQEWAAVVHTMNKYAKDTAYLGIVVCPSGFTKGCEPWATTSNLALIPPLKGNNMVFPPERTIVMFERVLRALKKRLSFPYEDILSPPEFYDFAYRLTSDFEGHELSDTTGIRYVLTKTAWKSSFAELVSALMGKEIAEVLATANYTGLRFTDGTVFRFTEKAIAFGLDDAHEEAFQTPVCKKNLSMDDCTFEDVKAYVIGQTIRSAGDFGTYFEFGISNDINVGFHLGTIHAISTRNPPDENKL